jgi:hypothetical protein
MVLVDDTKLLKVVNPALAAAWHPTRNTDLSLTTVYANSGKRAWWLCPTCSYEWSAQIASRNSNGRGCPNCAGKIANDSNSLSALHPRIAAEYDPALNTKPVTEILANSHKKAWWTCSTDAEHVWETPIGNRVRQGDNCPYCSGRYPTKTNNLAVKYPSIAAEFDTVKNAPLTPYDFTPSSHKKVWWKCSQGHEWEVAVGSRVRKNALSYCPYCTGTKAASDNNLLMTHPEIAKEYHPTLNRTPVTEVRYGSKTHRWWLCLVNPSHTWQAVVTSRTRKTRPTGCPECSPTPRTSKIEITIREALSSQKILTAIHTTYNAFIQLDNDKRAAVDILGEYGDRKVVVEYDSWWWHSGKGSNHSYQLREERDVQKTKDLIRSGYIVIRIREERKDVALPLLPLDNDQLHQLRWNQEDGIAVLMEQIQTILAHHA